jgi:predicted metal-binding membrane protein
MQRWVDRAGLSSSVLTALLLLAMTVAAWLATVRADSTMQMGQRVDLVSLEAGAVYALQWGVMMAAMMLPSATPMILLYKAVSRGPAAREERVISAESFALVYLGLWLLTGIPVYLASTAMTALTLRSTALASAMPYMVAGTLIAAGLYQLSSLKRACLRECDAPMNFLMRDRCASRRRTRRIASAAAGR